VDVLVRLHDSLDTREWKVDIVLEICRMRQAIETLELAKLIELAEAPPPRRLSEDIEHCES
jgi:hypothetical protein